MSTERVLFAFVIVIVLALTLNVGFIAGDFADMAHHNVYELFEGLVVSLLATVMKFGDHSPLGSGMLTTSLVADMQLVAAVFTVRRGLHQPWRVSVAAPLAVAAGCADLGLPRGRCSASR
ncbi:MAG: DUF6394 family protein [Pseudomonadota bacterium]|nr:DUF6394 family protein [Pseudomonadota bacterium]